jgi:uncharacterized phage protein (TIGR01671 family)
VDFIFGKMGDGVYIDNLMRLDLNDENASQFTGLKDKNGVEIYDGDILGSDVDIRFEDIEHGEYAGDFHATFQAFLKDETTYQIEWSGTGFHVIARDLSGSCVRVFGPGDGDLDMFNARVIGNKFENHELPRAMS